MQPRQQHRTDCKLWKNYISIMFQGWPKNIFLSKDGPILDKIENRFFFSSFFYSLSLPFKTWAQHLSPKDEVVPRGAAQPPMTWPALQFLLREGEWQGAQRQSAVSFSPLGSILHHVWSELLHPSFTISTRSQKPHSSAHLMMQWKKYPQNPLTLEN